MKLIVITAEHFFDKEPEAINRLFENGMEVLHVRKPRAPVGRVIHLMERIDAVFHPRIVVPNYELTSLFAVKGIHLSRRDLDLWQPGRTGRRLSLSCSCHSFEEIAAAVVDYMFLSPIFDSISKAGYKQGYTPEQLIDARDRHLINDRVIALGGITAERIPAVCRYGFGGVAVLGALWADGNTDGLLQRFDELKTACSI
ncbi:MAG: thiamine phosphate synthase [Tannerella sp.]|jgi:thiamine-phosphate pyrophosphorylase|nr:thiamine phosphate synthase [Tannerella sp.]